MAELLIWMALVPDAPTALIDEANGSSSVPRVAIANDGRAFGSWQTYLNSQYGAWIDTLDP